jgi:nitroreductase
MTQQKRLFCIQQNGKIETTFVTMTDLICIFRHSIDSAYEHYPVIHMETLEAIHTRRSIRRFTSKKVDDSDIQKIIHAGMMAPSAGNEQPWQFLVICNRQTLDEIPKAHPYAEMVPQTSAAILLCGDLTLETRKGYWVQDCAAAMENMLLATHALGLAGVWLGVHPREPRTTAIRNLFALPEHIVPFSILPIGYAAEKKEKVDRFDPSRIHYEKW